MRTSLLLVPVMLAAVCFAACEQDSVVFDDGSNNTATTTSASGGSGGGGASTTTSQSGGSGGTTSNGGSGGTSTCTDLGEPCTQCELQNCADEYCGCYDDQTCGNLFLCLSVCTPNDLNCYQACYTNNASAVSTAALLSHCAAVECLNECPGAIELDGCEVCLYEQCDSEMNTCVANPDCSALLVCLDGCGSPGCENGCYTQYPNGLADAGAVGNCLQANCATECQ